MIPSEVQGMLTVCVMGSIIATTLSLTIFNISMSHSLLGRGLPIVLTASLLFSFSWVISLIYVIAGATNSWILELAIHLLFIGAIFILLTIIAYFIKIEEILFYLRENKKSNLINKN